LERPGQLWAGSSGARWKDFCHYVGFSWAGDWQSHFCFKAPTPNSTKLLGLTSTLTLQAAP
jgi:hypothetical protein